MAVFAAAVAVSACSRTALRAVPAGDSGTTFADLRLAEDPPADLPLVLTDAPTDAGAAKADGGPDAAVPGRVDAGPDVAETGRDGAGPDAAETGPDTRALVRDSVGRDAVAAEDVVADMGSEAADAAADVPGPDTTVGGDASPRDRFGGELAEAGGNGDAEADSGGPLACTRTLVSKGMWTMPLGGQAHAMAVGDLNGDGNLDIVTANGNYALSVSLGTGNGTLVAGASYETGQEGSVAVGDLDGDGALDVVTTNYTNGLANVWLGRGDGTLAAPVGYAVGEGPRRLALADVNADGSLDVVTTNWGDHTATATVLLGKGDGTFAGRVDYPFGEAQGLAIGDVTGDGRPDIVAVLASSATGSILPGKGDGTFAGKLDFRMVPGDGSDYGGRSLALGDLDGDGRLDVVLVTDAEARLTVLLGKTAGTFSAPMVLPYVSASGVALADLNRDGRLDIVFGDRFDGVVSVLPGNGDGAFGAKLDYPTARQLDAWALGDLNHDGWSDLALAFGAEGRGTLGTVLGKADGIFPDDLAFTSGEYPYSVALGDFDGDGKPDVVTANYYDGTASVLLGKGDGTFAARKDYPTGDRPAFATTGDVNADGRLDIVIARPEAATISVLLGNGDGSFATKADYPTGPGPYWVALGDLDDDGRLDIVTTSTNGKSSDTAGAVSVLRGIGAGRFGPRMDYAAGVDPQAVALGDLDGDGKLDIVVANGRVNDAWSMGVLLGKGNGTFAAAVNYQAGIGPQTIALGDLDRDGKLDVVMAGDGLANTVTVWLGNGDGTFAAKVEYPTPAFAQSVALGDLDGDGKLDIAVANPILSLVSVLHGTGDGTFGPHVDYGLKAGTLTIGDVNGDGTLDVVTASYHHSVAVLQGSCR